MPSRVNRHTTRRIAALALVLTVCRPALGWARDPVHRQRDTVVVSWNQALLQAVRASRLGPVVTARALAIVHTCMYEAWAAYDASALGTIAGHVPKRPKEERTRANKEVAVSHAAYRALVDLFPSEQALFAAVMARRGLDARNDAVDPSTAPGVGNHACRAVLESRRHDGSNQHGDLNEGAAYSDYTGYTPVNTPEQLVDPNRWQPLRSGTGATQAFLAPHWGLVTPFALEAAGALRPPPPPMYPDARYLEQAEEVRALSARLDDRAKAIAEYWADGPGSETPPGHWSLFAQYVSRRDGHDLDTDVRLFFVLGNALFDVSIAVWDCKRTFDSIRPVSAIRFLFAGQSIVAWAGPYQGTRTISGERFHSYIPTPPFPEYVSGHSAFSAAAATVLRLFTGSPYFGAHHTFRAGTSTIEPGATPARDVTLRWNTFEDAAAQAGLSRRYGGIHFRDADLESRALGKRIALVVSQKALSLFRGRK